jgi:hypothetical protein
MNLLHPLIYREKYLINLIQIQFVSFSLWGNNRLNGFYDSSIISNFFQWTLSLNISEKKIF